MIEVLQANPLPLVIALVLGLVIAWWMFRATRRTDTAEGEQHVDTAPPPAAPLLEEERPLPRSVDTPEGNSVVDSGAAAATDVVGQFVGVDAHAELPGASGPPDNLQMLKGVGPRLAEKLNEQGITRFEHLARLSPDEIAGIEDKLGAFKGRLGRDRVVEQASYLARDDRAGFEARFGKLGSGTL